MSTQPSRPSARRPLADASQRVNHVRETQLPSKPEPMHHESLRPECHPPGRRYSPSSPLAQDDHYPLRDPARAGSPAANPRLSAISKDHATESNRNSQISTVSTNASDGKKIKSSIGPWKLGKTLGKGSTARVRLARHAFSGQQAAIKIVQKNCAQISQASSLAALDKIDCAAPDPSDGTRKMPIGIEREVAIMKLVQHPNIIKLLDIWENRTEM
jgi:serine/threonine-protein kinase HSL1 (negative regulator of Swe1 kinase)